MKHFNLEKSIVCDKCITIAEAYADYRVMKALDDAYRKVRELEKQLLTEAHHIRGPQAASFAANQIRDLMTK